MDHAAFQSWLDRYIDAWRLLDPVAIGDLFSPEVRYAFDPFSEAVVGRPAVVASWLTDADEPGSWEADYEVLAIDGDTYVAHGRTRYLTDDRSTVDNVLLFVPNETVSAFIHESDVGLIEEAMASKVVICSPLTLFAFLGVIRQAFDNFVIEETSQEILQLLGKFGQQWGKYTEQVDKVKRNFDTVNRSFDELATTRRRQLERPLNAIEDLRRKQRLPIDGQLFGIDETGEVESELDNVRELGA